MNTRHFHDLVVRQRSMELARRVYALTAEFPKSELFGLSSQLRRAAVSLPSNIAEGHGRLTDKGFAVFLGQARGSLYEMQTQIELAGDLGFLSPENAQTLMSEAVDIARLLNGLLGAVRSTSDRTVPNLR
ncbi:MAG: four helix bundle protein [Acidobacteriaceae bacterium]